MFRETRINILVTGSLLIQESKLGTKDCQSNNSQSRRRIIVYLGNRKQSAIFGMKGERGYISAFFSPSKDKIPPKIFFYCKPKKHRFLLLNMLNTGIFFRKL